MTTAVLFMLAIGLVCVALLSMASRVFYVWEDPKIAEVERCLAGANCGGCGYAGCAAAAAAVVAGKAPVTVCVVGGKDCAEQVAAVMGVEVGVAEPLKSLNYCLGGHRADDRFAYAGVMRCRANALLYGGKRECRVGCLGFGDCVRSCLFDAIHMGPEGYPVVNTRKCVGCGACEKACPKDILTVRTMSQRLLEFNQEDSALSPCRQACPAQIDIPRYIRQIRSGEYGAAIDTVRERNPLPLSIGRVCPHPCESKCRRGLEDDPVSINQLKRFAADWEMNTGRRRPIPCAPATGHSVAVVGGGPGGLSCAYFLRRLGHDVTIFEAMPKLGGMLRYGIPEYRLPKKVLDWEIQGILDLGITARTSLQLGVDYTVGSLVTGFDAIFLGLGAWEDHRLRVEGEDLEGCTTGIRFLQRMGRGEAVRVGRRAAVVGGGNTAIDCARTLVRLGVEEVYLVYRRTRDEMPANPAEVEAAEHEGVKFLFLAAPLRAVGDEHGRLTHLEYQQMQMGEPDESGRRRPVPIPDSETLLPLDNLVTAIGQAPDLSFRDADVQRLQEFAVTRWNTVQSDPELLQSTVPYIFTAGDAATGPSLVVEAIGGGRRAARSIHRYLSGEPVEPVPDSLFKKFIPESLFERVQGVIPTPRAAMPELPVGERIQSFAEAELTLSDEDAQRESKRCLACCRLCTNRDAA